MPSNAVKDLPKAVQVTWEETGNTSAEGRAKRFEHGLRCSPAEKSPTSRSGYSHGEAGELAALSRNAWAGEPMLPGVGVDQACRSVCGWMVEAVVPARSPSA